MPTTGTTREPEETTFSNLDVETVVRILDEVPVTLGVLYSSHARGDATERSDIDLAVAFDESLSSVERTRARLGLIERLSTELATNDVDVVPFSRVPDELLEEILIDGFLIHGSMEDLESYQPLPPHRRVTRTGWLRSMTSSKNSNEWCNVYLERRGERIGDKK